MVLSNVGCAALGESHFAISLIVIVGASPLGELRTYRSLISSIVVCHRAICSIPVPDIWVGEVGMTIAVALVEDHSRNPRRMIIAGVIEDPERIRRFIDSCTQSSMFAQTLQDVVLSSLALVHSPVICSRR